jgi:hypothetical protein
MGGLENNPTIGIHIHLMICVILIAHEQLLPHGEISPLRKEQQQSSILFRVIVILKSQ